jgi:hypothetical protein
MTEKSALRRCPMGQQNFDDEEVEVEKTESTDMRETVFIYGGLFFLAFLLLIIVFGLSSCTVNQNMTLSDGDKSGNLKDTTETTAEPTTDLSMPLEGH